MRRQREAAGMKVAFVACLYTALLAISCVNAYRSKRSTKANQGMPECPSLDVCKGDDPYNTRLFSHPTDCQKFCRCRGGHAYEITCPHGLYFNQLYRVCDTVEHSGCNPKPGVPRTAPLVKKEDQPAPSKAEKPPSNGNKLPQCPSLDVCEGDDPFVTRLFPHPYDCRKYCHCTTGYAYEKTCPSDLYFNPVARVCDRQIHSGCEQKQVPRRQTSSESSMTASDDTATTLHLATTQAKLSTSTKPVPFTTKRKPETETSSPPTPTHVMSNTPLYTPTFDVFTHERLTDHATRSTPSDTTAAPSSTRTSDNELANNATETFVPTQAETKTTTNGKTADTALPKLSSESDTVTNTSAIDEAPDSSAKSATSTTLPPTIFTTLHPETTTSPVSRAVSHAETDQTKDEVISTLRQVTTRSREGSTRESEIGTALNATADEQVTHTGAATGVTQDTPVASPDDSVTPSPYDTDTWQTFFFSPSAVHTPSTTESQMQSSTQTPTPRGTNTEAVVESTATSRSISFDVTSAVNESSTALNAHQTTTYITTERSASSTAEGMITSTAGETKLNTACKHLGPTGMAPHQCDCTLFYLCSDENDQDPQVFKCPSRLHFNRALLMCDLPEHAGCTYDT